ncbi:RNA RECOGNITION MOTIF XS DOMAIN PROTEIN-RELATED [Salix koriyanagi]|uniref:RNA RECOGNITION MOTIF XS DOMAIN PROTEIN-RELATED n=1 Tax=Salix koriyanagi TaxID=2511006 RepID=A0A9Q1AE04_9ROSI|nr:RNA RECOGNITION MOTIF XS DOMAIN PROTEIN-RELATED [Salix koriyanagi]
MSPIVLLAIISGDRSPRVQQRRSLSPRSKVEVSRRVVQAEGRSSSTERRDYDRHLGAGRTEKVRPGSPQYVQEHRKPHSDEGAVHRKYRQVEDMNYDDGKSNRLKRGYDHNAAPSRVSKEKNYRESRAVGIDGHDMLGQKSVTMQDGLVRGPYRVPDLVPNSSYGDTGAHKQFMSRDMDIGHFEDEELRFREPIPSDKIPVREFYEEEERLMFHSRNVPRTRMPAPHSKDSESTSRFEKFAGSSSGFSRSEFPSSYREGMPLAESDEYPRSSMKLTERMDFNTYRERPVMDIRDRESGKRIITSYPQGVYNSKRASDDHFLYSRSQGNVNDDHAYLSDGMHRMMSPPSSLDYEHARIDYEHRESSRLSMHPVRDRTEHGEGSYINMRRSTIFDHPPIQKQATVENLDVGRIQHASKHNADYLSSAYTRGEFGQGELQDNRKSHLCVTQNHQIPHSRSNYGGLLPRGKGQGKSLPYTNHQINHSSGGEEWVNEDAGDLHESRTQRFYQSAHRNAKRTYDRQDILGDSASEAWLSSQDSLSLARRHSTRHYKPGVKYMNGHPRSGPLSCYNTHQTDRKSGVHRQNRIWKRNDDFGEEANVIDDGQPEDWVNLGEAEPPEGSEEFKQLVDEAFLLYSKRLNLNSAVQRRYKEQGKAGSLFCIVCGKRSVYFFCDMHF